MAVMARSHGKFLLVSSESFEPFGDSGSLITPGDSSSPPLACSELSLRSDNEETLRRDCIESVRLTASGNSSG